MTLTKVGRHRPSETRRQKTGRQEDRKTRREKG
jgi:hypothetical protein